MSHREKSSRFANTTIAAMVMGVIWVLFVAASFTEYGIAQTGYRNVYVNGTYVGNVELSNLTNTGMLNIYFHPVNNDLNILNQYNLEWWQVVNRPNDSNYPRIDPPNGYHINAFNDANPGYYTNFQKSNQVWRNVLYNGNNAYIRDSPGPGNGVAFETWLVTGSGNNAQRLVCFNWGIGANGGTINNLSHPNFINNSQFNLNECFNRSRIPSRTVSDAAETCAGVVNPTFVGPGMWRYSLSRLIFSAPIPQLIFTDLAPGTFAFVSGPAAENWFVQNIGPDFVIFQALDPFNPSPQIGEFVLQNPAQLNPSDRPLWHLPASGCGALIAGPGGASIESVNCPPEAIQEGEPLCFDEYVDNYDGGCNSLPPVYLNIPVPSMVCGQSGTYMAGGSQTRDTDWYQVDLITPSTLTWTVTASFPVLIFILGPGVSGCADLVAYTGGGVGNPYEQVLQTAACLQPGTYWLFIAPSQFSGVPCGSPYLASVTASSPCSPPPSNDDCLGAIDLLVPGGVDGSTALATVDATPICEGAPQTAPGVWYKVTGVGARLTATLCNGADYDTRLTVFCGSGCGGLTCVGANDDYCGLSSQVEWCSENGRDYYIMVHGFDAATGNFHLDVSFNDDAPCFDPPPCAGGGCDVICQGGDLIESVEPMDSTNATNDPDGGCNNGAVPQYGTVACEQTTCGRCFTYTGPGGASYRDTDWFLFTTTGFNRVAMTVTAEFPVLYGIVDHIPCDSAVFMIANTVTTPCSTTTVETLCLPPGDYVMLVAPTVFVGIPAPLDYRASLVCTPCVPPGPPVNDNCTAALPIFDGTTPFSNEGATSDGPNDAYPCDVPTDIWYCYNRTCSGSITVSLCGSGYDSELAVYRSDGCACPLPGTALACNDDFCSLQSQVSFTAATPGQYMIRVGGWNGSQGSGVIAITSTPPCPCDAVTNLTCLRVGNDIRLSWTTMQAGTYTIYSTTDKNTTAVPPSAPWSVVASLPLPGTTATTYTDPNPLAAPYLRYVIVVSCP